MASEEHGIRVESTQIFRGYVSPDESELLTGEGEAFDRTLRKPNDGMGPELEFHKEEKLTYECECGRRFRKGETARDHLDQHRADTAHNGTTNG